MKVMQLVSLFWEGIHEIDELPNELYFKLFKLHQPVKNLFHLPIIETTTGGSLFDALFVLILIFVSSLAVEPLFCNCLLFPFLGALFEYFRTIGHPVHNELLDPKQTLLKIW